MPRSGFAESEGRKAEERAGFHRALADHGRAQMVHELMRAREGLTVEDFAGRLRLHPNTVRWHLRILEEAGLVFAHGQERPTRGRPRVVYRLTADGVVAEGADERLLVLILAGVVAQLVDGLAMAETLGDEWARSLPRRPAPLALPEADEVLAELALTLDALGFPSEPTPDGIRLRRSRFDSLVARYPNVVEALLRGVVTGVLAEISSGLELYSLTLPTEVASGTVALRPTPSPDTAVP